MATVSAARPSFGAVVGASILAGIAIVIGLILLIVPGLFLITIWAVIVPVIVIERSGALASFGRSRELVRGRGWHVFATLVLVYVILLVVNGVLDVIFRALPHVWGTGLATVISGTVISPFLALVVTLVYYRLSGPPTGGGGPSRRGPADHRRTPCLPRRTSARQVLTGTPRISAQIRSPRPANQQVSELHCSGPPSVSSRGR